MKVIVDCKVNNTKRQFLTEMQKTLAEMYSPNYDAFIDGSRGVEKPLTIEVLNFDCYDDKQNLTEIFDIITQENPLINFIIK